MTDIKQLLGIDFSDEQMECIQAPLTPGVIVAGAGSGKTTVMAARVVWLVASGLVEPGEVLGLTFTTKAASELAQRVQSALAMLGPLADDAGEPTVMTYDAFASRVVADYGSWHGLDLQPIVVSGAQRYQLAVSVVAQSVGPFEQLGRRSFSSVVDMVLALDQAMASHLVAPDQVAEHATDFMGQLTSAPHSRTGPYASIVKAQQRCAERVDLLGLVQEYRREKQRRGVVEFADQMALAHDLASQVESVSHGLREQYRVVLLDEYQDTSSAQVGLLAALFSGVDAAHGRGHPVTAVGDPLQAIYGWRGAAATTITQFPAQFPNADGSPSATYTLTVNRRSGPQILRLANAVSQDLRADTVMAAAMAGRDTALAWPPDATPAVVEVADFQTWDDEVNWIGDAIVADVESGSVQRWSDIAILTRVNADLASVYSALKQREVPCEIVGLGGLLGLPEVAHVVAVLRLIDDVGANEAAAFLLSSERWRVGASDLAALGQHAARIARVDESSPGPCLVEAIATVDQSGVSREGRDRLRRFATELTQLRRYAIEPVPELVRRVIDALGLESELIAAAPDGVDPMVHVRAFLNVVDAHVDVVGNRPLAGMLAYFDAELAQGGRLDQATPSGANSVKLMTVHRAKGLEWDVVYLPNLSAGVFPAQPRGENWVTSSGQLPYPLRQDRAALPTLAEVTNKSLDDFGKQISAAHLSSERRLAYVAVTRARRRVIATRHAWRAGRQTPKAASDYFELAWQAAEREGVVRHHIESVADVNPTALLSETFQWPEPVDHDRVDQLRVAADMVGRAALKDRQTPGDLSSAEQARVSAWQRRATQFVREHQRPSQPTLTTSLAVSTVTRSRTAPQQLFADVVRPMPHRPTGPNRIGTQFHEWVEQFYTAAPTLDIDLPRATSAALDRLIERFLTGPYRDRVPLAIEEPFALLLGEHVLRGRIDAVFASLDPEFDYQVVDWKTFDGPADEWQLAFYRAAWAEAMGIDPGRVDAVFYHVGSGEIQRPARLATPAELARLLAELTNG